jgi:hypothetical protein
MSRRTDFLHFEGLAVLSQNVRFAMECGHGSDALYALDQLAKRVEEVRPEVEAAAAADVAVGLFSADGGE